jgi:hypothetical protein
MAITFAELLTPEEAYKQYAGRNPKPPFTLDELRRMASDKSRCQCGQPVWRMVGQGLCFSCTTGESDASEDYELAFIPRKRK